MDDNDLYFKDYNTQREKLIMPEHGRHVQKMIEHVVSMEDPEKRREQLQCIVDVMRSLEGHGKDNAEAMQKLWDHVQVISHFKLQDGDAPYPVLREESKYVRPNPIVRNTRPIRATHYGRNIESIIDVIANRPDDEMKTSMIRSLAIYMRQQYLIWNKDSVTDDTIFKDIERMSSGRIKVPEDLVLTKIASDATFARPGLNPVSKRNKSQNAKKNKQQQAKRRNS